MDKKRWLNLLRILISVGILVVLFWRIGLGETLTILRQADLRYWLIALTLFLCSLAIRAWRWLVLIRGLGVAVDFWRLLRLYFVGAFFNAMLPSSFGGDVVRAFELTQDTDPSAAVGTVLVDRMTGLLTLFAMGLAVLPFIARRLPVELVAVIVGVAGGGLIVGGVILESRLLKRIGGWLPAPFSLTGEGPLAKIYAAVTGCGLRAILQACGISFFFNLLNVLINWLCGKTVGAQIGLDYFFAVTLLLSVSGLIPSIGGWGVREATSAALLTPLGVDENVAVALGLVVGTVHLAAGLSGGVIYALEGWLGLRANARTDGRFS
jgi:glycosyltransferase 2 family protein